MLKQKLILNWNKRIKQLETNNYVQVGDRGFKWWCASKIAKSPLDNLSL